MEGEESVERGKGWVGMTGSWDWRRGDREGEELGEGERMGVGRGERRVGE